ncbi:MAG: indolepyruvate oxidoreductase subunit beta [Clostridia bacterium]|nr:indolepyruvate oxidoreductase subunit beta [Clostridia bacterium]
MKYDVLIAGVGGQGTVLASRMIALAAIDAGLFTRTSETIGMAQRGGSVVSHVRVDSSASSPIIPMSTSDVIIAFELAEAARSLPRLKKGGKCIINTQIIKPVTASLGNSAYDSDEIIGFIKKNVPKAVFIDGYSLAEKAGSVKAVNIVLLGAACAAGMLPFSKESLEKAIKENVPEKYLNLNIKALNSGYDSVNNL